MKIIDLLNFNSISQERILEANPNLTYKLRNKITSNVFGKLDNHKNKIKTAKWELEKEPELANDSNFKIPSKYLDKNKQIELKGVGGLGGVVAHIKSPKDVYKISTVVDLEKDGYLTYLLELMKNNMFENPYAPKVHDIVVYKTETGEGKYKVKLEKLEKYSKNTDDLEQILRTILFENSANKVLEKENLWLSIPHIIGNYINSGKYEKHIKDENLTQICGIIRKLYKEGFYLDIRPANLMIRIDNNIPELVIIDPLGSKFD